MKPATDDSGSQSASIGASDAPNPVLIFQALNAFQLSAVLRGAIELDLFTAVAAGYRSAAELAQACDADGRAIRIICDFLTVHGFLIKRDDHYQLSPTSAVFLDKKSPRYLGATAKFINSPHLLQAFDDVAAARFLRNRELRGLITWVGWNSPGAWRR